MTSREKHVLGAALQLTEKQRARLVAELLASMDGPPESDAEAQWATEIERRARRALSGESVGLEWSTVRKKLKKSSRRR